MIVRAKPAWWRGDCRVSARDVDRRACSVFVPLHLSRIAVVCRSSYPSLQVSTSYYDELHVETLACSYT